MDTSWAQNWEERKKKKKRKKGYLMVDSVRIKMCLFCSNSNLKNISSDQQRLKEADIYILLWLVLVKDFSRYPERLLVCHNIFYQNNGAPSTVTSCVLVYTFCVLECTHTFLLCARVHKYAHTHTPPHTHTHKHRHTEIEREKWSGWGRFNKWHGELGVNLKVCHSPWIIRWPQQTAGWVTHGFVNTRQEGAWTKAAHLPHVSTDAGMSEKMTWTAIFSSNTHWPQSPAWSCSVVDSDSSLRRVVAVYSFTDNGRDHQHIRFSLISLWFTKQH